LFIGAMLGGAVGGVEQSFFPQLSIPVGAYALIGMGTLFAGILRAPMTSVVMILEVSGNYSIILPVIVSNSIAYLISRSFQRVPIFDLLSRQDGLDLPSLEEEREVAILRVEDALSPFGEQVLDGNDTLVHALDMAQNAKGDFFLVQLPGGRWTGVSRQTLLELEPDGRESLGARLNMFIPALYPDQSLETALRQISDWPFLPVVHRADPSMLIGIISVQDVINAYRKARVEEPEDELQPN
jgi:CIC family chloride channel protein